MLALFAVVALAAFLFIRSMLSDSDLRRARRLVWHNQASYLAEAGLEIGLLAREKGSPESPWIFDVGGSKVYVEELAGEPYMAELRATATVGDVTVERSVVLLPQMPPGGQP